MTESCANRAPVEKEAGGPKAPARSRAGGGLPPEAGARRGTAEMSVAAERLLDRREEFLNRFLAGLDELVERGFSILASGSVFATSAIS